MDVEEYRKSVPDGLEDDNNRKGANELTWFRLLQELSELLMLPKDLLLEAPIRQEVITIIYLIFFRCYHKVQLFLCRMKMVRFREN